MRPIFSDIQLVLSALLLLSIGGLSCAEHSNQSNKPNLRVNAIGNLPLPSPTASPSTDDAEYTNDFHKALTLAESDKEAAIAEMEHALTLRPNDKVALKWIADWYSTLNKPEEEADVYRRWVRAYPNDERVHGLLSALLVRELKQYENGLAETHLAQSLCIGPMCYVYEKQIAEAYEGLGDYRNAIEHYQRYLKGSKKQGNPDPHREILKKMTELAKKI